MTTYEAFPGGNILSPEWPANVDKYETRVGSEHPEFDGEEVVLESELELDGKKILAYLTKTKICWCATYSSTKTRKQRRSTHVINVADVILTNYEQPNGKKSHSPNEIELFPSQYFSIHFAKKCKNHRWKYQHILFHTLTSEICQAWVEKIQNLLTGFNRPKSLLVFINPVGGKKQAGKIYNEKVARLLDLAKIHQQVIVTEYQNHAKDYLQTEDLSPYDGVLSVGGDGMFSEIINGLLKCEDGTPCNQYSNTRRRPLMLGIIPAGSTDTVAYCTSGTNDPVTAALHIILGDELPLDVCSVWHDGRFLKYSVSLMGYGYFGDLAKESEALRWMGPKRYDYAGLKRFIANKSYACEISFIESPDTNTDNTEKVQCKSGCERCSMFLDEPDATYNSEEWKTISGRFISIIGANISCRCARSTTGLSPHAHTGDGHIDLILIQKTTRTKYLHHLIKVSEKTSNQFDFNFIDVYRVKEVKFKPIPSCNLQDDNANSESRDDSSVSPGVSNHTETSVWNVDGEILDVPDIHIKVHRQLVSVFARGIED